MWEAIMTSQNWVTIKDHVSKCGTNEIQLTKKITHSGLSLRMSTPYVRIQLQ